MKKKILFFSGSRAEYNIQYPILKTFQNNKFFKTFFVVAGSHTSGIVGNTFKQIKKDKIKVSHKIKLKLSSNLNLELNKYSIDLQDKFAKILIQTKPDCIFLTSDRFETLSVAMVSHFLRIPIIHLEGGDVTEGGTLDDNSRHAITKLSSFHLVTNKDSEKRVLKMGETKNRVLNVGFPPLTNINRKKLFTKTYIEKNFNIQKNQKVILFTYHPVPSELTRVNIIFKSLKKIQNKNIKIIVTYPNFDPGYDKVLKYINNLNQSKENFIIKKNLGRKMYFSLLNYLGNQNKGICMGNSSSGIKETLFFNCKTINLGSRQKTRLKTRNIYECDVNYSSILKKTSKILRLKKDFSKTSNPYYYLSNFKKVDKKIFKFLNSKNYNKKTISY